LHAYAGQLWTPIESGMCRLGFSMRPDALDSPRQHLLSRHQVRKLESFGEPPVDRSQESDRLGLLTLHLVSIDKQNPTPQPEKLCFGSTFVRVALNLLRFVEKFLGLAIETDMSQRTGRRGTH